MTIDERIEFLMQSIESHDRQIGELVEHMHGLGERMHDLGARMHETTSNIDALGTKVARLAETTQINFDRLTTAMMGLTEHVVDHQRRIENLER